MDRQIRARNSGWIARIVACLPVLLFLVPDLSWASSSMDDAVTDSIMGYAINIFEPVSASMGLYNLGLIFGNVGDALTTTSGSLLMANIFTILNYAGLTVVALFTMYQVMLMYLYSSQDGSPMAGRLSFMPLLRISVATALLLPQYSGYSLANVLGMQYVIVYGNNMADNIWSYTLNYLYNTGGYVISSVGSATGSSGEYSDLDNMSFKAGISTDKSVYYPPNFSSNTYASAYNLYYSAVCTEMLYQQYLSYCNSSTGDNDDKCTTPYTASQFGAVIEPPESSDSTIGTIYYGGPGDSPTYNKNTDDTNTSMLYKGVCGTYSFTYDGSYITSAVTQMVNDIQMFAVSWVDDVVSTFNSCVNDGTNDFDTCMSGVIDYDCSTAIANGDPTSCQPANTLVAAGSDFYSISEPAREQDATDDASDWWGTTAATQGWMSAGQYYRSMVGGDSGGTSMSDLTDWTTVAVTANYGDTSDQIDPGKCSSHYPSLTPDPFCAWKHKERDTQLMEVYTYLQPWYIDDNALKNSNKHTQRQLNDLQDYVDTNDPQSTINYYGQAQDIVSNMEDAAVASTAESTGVDGYSSVDMATSILLQTFYYNDPTPTMDLYVDGTYLTVDQASTPLDYLTQVLMMDLTAITGLNFVRDSSKATHLYDVNLINYKNGSDTECKNSSVKDACNTSTPSGCYDAAKDAGCIIQGIGILGQMMGQDNNTYYDPLYIIGVMGGTMFNASIDFFSSLLSAINGYIYDIAMDTTGTMAAILGVTATAAAAGSAFLMIDNPGGGQMLAAGVEIAGKIPALFVQVIGELDKAALFAYVPIASSIVTATMVTGVTLSVWSQFIPYIVFTTVAISVFFTYIEFMIGTTLFAMGMAYEGHDFLGAAQGLMPIAVSAFMAPTMVLTGFYVFILANYIFVNYFNSMMLGVFSNTLDMFINASGWTRLFAVPAVVIFYVMALVEIITFNASVMPKFKNSLARFLGGQPEPDMGGAQALQMLQSMRQSGESTTQQAGSGGGSAVQSQASVSGAQPQIEARAVDMKNDGDGESSVSDADESSGRNADLGEGDRPG